MGSITPFPIMPEHEAGTPPGAWTPDEDRAAERIIKELKATDPSITRTEMWIRCSKRLSEVGFVRAPAAIQRRFGKPRPDQPGEPTPAVSSAPKPAGAVGTPNKLGSVLLGPYTAQQDGNSFHGKGPDSESGLSKNVDNLFGTRSLRPRDKSVNYSITQALERTLGDDDADQMEGLSFGSTNADTKKRRRSSGEKGSSLGLAKQDPVPVMSLQEPSSSASSPETTCKTENIPHTKKPKLQNAFLINLFGGHQDHTQFSPSLPSKLPVKPKRPRGLGTSYPILDNLFREHEDIAVGSRSHLGPPQTNFPPPPSVHNPFATNTGPASGGTSNPFGTFRRCGTGMGQQQMGPVEPIRIPIFTSMLPPPSDDTLKRCEDMLNNRIRKVSDDVKASRSEAGPAVSPSRSNSRARTRANMIQATKQRITALGTKRAGILSSVQTANSRLEALQQQLVILQNQVLTKQNEIREFKKINVDKGDLDYIDYEIAEEESTLARLEQADQAK